MPGEEMMGVPGDMQAPITEGMPIQPEDSMAGSPPPVADAADMTPDLELPQLQ
jgi:hypothetical protein